MTTVRSFAVALVLSLAACSETKTPSDAVHVSFEKVLSPSHELCMDDTLSATEEVNVPLLQVSGSSMALNGKRIEQSDLQTWAERTYRGRAEQVLYVEMTPDSRAFGEQVLRPVVESLPKLHLREVAADLRCPTVIIDRHILLKFPAHGINLFVGGESALRRVAVKDGSVRMARTGERELTLKGAGALSYKSHVIRIGGGGMTLDGQLLRDGNWVLLPDGTVQTGFIRTFDR